MRFATIIAGGRNYQFTPEDEAWLDTLPIGEVISGGATGADRCGESWARRRNLYLRIFPADWNAHGKAAGYLRNLEMSVHADAVVLFPGGKGTANMKQIAIQQNLIIFEPPKKK